MTWQANPTFRHVYLPYCLHRIKGTRRWVILNREYTPLGTWNRDCWSDWDKAPYIVLTQSQVRKFRSLSRMKDNVDWVIAFYDDYVSARKQHMKYLHDVMSYFCKFEIHNATQPILVTYETD